MKKAIYKNTGMAYDFSELKKEEQIGFDSEYLWKAVSYFGSPKYSGKYLVIQKSGCITQMMNTGNYSYASDARALFDLAASCEESCNETAYIDDREMTDTDLMNLYRNPYGIWYKVNDWTDEYGDSRTDVRVFTEESEYYPLYFLDLDIQKPIKLTDDGEIADVDGIQYYKRNKRYELVKETEADEE